MASLEGTTIIIFLILVVIALYMARNERRMRLFLRSGGSTNLGESFKQLEAELATLKSLSANQTQKIAGLDARVAKSIQKIETVRFNAFPDAGGGQSFATALLDEEGTGVVFSTLYLRDRVSMFAKPIVQYTSSFNLTPEETEAVQKSKGTA